MHTSAIIASTYPLLAQDSGVLGAPSGNQATTTAPGSADAATTTAPAPGGTPFMFMILIMFAGMIILTAFSGRKERKKQADLLASIGKKDKVRAAGGIIGTVIEIKNDEVLLETDRASNTRIRVAKASITTLIESKSNKSNESSDQDTNAQESETAKS